MGLTSALNTSLNGLVLNETTIDVLGNNIANAGTNGFKASNALFATQLSRTYSVGSRANGNSAGTNPRQVGLGANTAAIVKDFTQGNVTNSASPSDLAIEGDGFFILQGAGGQTYSRAGNFYRNNTNLLVNSRGDRVQGYAVDDEFNLITTGLTDLRIPLGELNVAQQTRNVTISGAVEPTGVEASSGTEILSGAMTDTSGPLAVGSLLTNLQNASGANLFTVGQTVRFAPHRGGQINQTIEIQVEAATTLQDFMNFMRDGMGIHTGPAIPNDPTSTNAPGVVLAGNQIRITGNLGTLNALNIQTGDLTVDSSALQLSFAQQQAATGESAVTNFVIYDSLGAPIDIKLATVLEQVTPTSTTFRWYLDSNGDSRRNSAVTSGTVTFDGMGNVIAGGIGSFDIERDDTAAVSPMTVTLDLSNVSGISSTTAGSRISLGTQDGSGPGTLVNFVIDDGGTINGVFDNGIIRTLGQVVLARFSNVQGLVEVGDTAYSEGISSGAPFFTTPGDFGAGTIRAGAVELSNTDIGRNLVDLIVASTNYRGNARVISSVQQLVEELFVLGR